MKNQEIALKKLFEGETRRSMITGSVYPASHLGTAVITFHVSSTSLITSWAVVATAKVDQRNYFFILIVFIIPT